MKCSSLLLAAALLGCASQKAEAPIPTPTAPVQAAAPAAAQAPVPPKLRLPETVRPTHYAVQLTLVPTEETFQGVVEVELNSREPLPVLWLNAEGLTVTKAEAKVNGQAIAGTPLPAPKDFVGVAFARPLPAGAATVRLEYSGPLSRKDQGGVTKQQVNGDWYVFSHFEPIDARRAFPCFDEPSFKAPWQLTVKVKKGDVAFSNTAVEAQTEGADGFVTYRFGQTLPLPSYLIAFAAGPLERVDAGVAGKNNTPMGIIVPKGMAEQARYAAEVSGMLLTRLEDYFNITYPYGKMDVIAVPYFGGAMEHPGLVTYTLPGVLSKPAAETINWRRRYADTITHEFAHQWFGDYVTTAWWDDLWLNEAFATWLTPKIIEEWQPTWGTAEVRVRDRGQSAGVDGLMTARRIRQPITSNDDMANAFDGITYGKGAAVIRMFERWVGQDRFQKGVQRYMREHAHGNATASQFLAAISAEAGRDVAPAFSTFLDQAGVPLVTVGLRCDAGQAPRLELSQQRYLPRGSDGDRVAQRWQIPICVRFGQGKEEGTACTLLAEEKGTLALDATGCPDWVLPNDGMAGYYRMAFEGDLLKKLLGRARLSAAEKVGVLGDVAALVRSGALPLGEVMGYAAPFAQDANRHVVQASLGITAGLRDDGLVPEAKRAAYAAYLRELYGKQARTLGFAEKPGESEDARLLRARLLPVVADEGEDPELLGQARKLADRWLVDRKAVSPELAPVVLGLSASHGDKTFFDALYKAAKAEKDQPERLRLFRAMGSFRRPEVVKAALGLLLTEEFDARETLFPLLFGSLDWPETRPIAYAFVKEHFDALVARMPRDSGAILPVVGASLCDDEHRAEVAGFFGERAARFTGGPRQLAQSLERMKLCSTFRQAQTPSVEQFLAAPRKAGVTAPR